jgi:D-alanine-D-alanine ligase-like ATP-grasp enzyme
MIERFGRVVIKPNWGNRGVGITTDVRTIAAARRAIARAQAVDLDEEALVEPYVAGTNVRVAVIGGEFVAAAEVRAAGVNRGELGGGAGAELERGFAAWGRGRAPGLEPMDRIEPDEDLVEHLKIHGVGLDEVLPGGAAIEVVGEEAEVIDRTEELHAGWARVAADACAWLGVDVGGVDLRGPIEVFRAAPGRGGVLLEVNVLPALHLHALPTQGVARPVFDKFVAYCLQLAGAPRGCAAVRV